MTAPKAPGTDPARSLHRKLAQIMYEAERIPKNGRAPKEMGGYSFVQVGDAADFIRKALAEKVLTMMPTAIQVVGQQDRPTKSGGSMTTVDLVTDWTITDGESGESITIQSFGAGADGGDKYSGKASTSAMKYALLTTFLLSTGEDSELGSSEAKAAPDLTPQLLGNYAKSGKVAKGTADGYKLDWREGPDGHVIGFRIDIDGAEKSIPQVVVKGPIGEALFLATSGDPSVLLGATIRFRGKLWGIPQEPPRKTFSRLVIGEHPDSDFLETADWRIPAATDANPDGVSPLRPEAESEPLPFDLAESARIDAEAAAAG